MANCPLTDWIDGTDKEKITFHCLKWEKAVYCDYSIHLQGNDKSKLQEKYMEDKKILLDNIEALHTTEMGIDRIKRNLKIDTADVVEYCKNKVLDKNCTVYKRGKNWYCEIDNIKVTVNSYSYTIITAHIIN